MSHCRACNCRLTWKDFKVPQDDGSEEDLCSSCLNVAYYPDQFYTKEYQFEEESDSLEVILGIPSKSKDIEY